MRLCNIHDCPGEWFRVLTKLVALVMVVTLVACFAPQTPKNAHPIDVARLEDALKPPVGFLPNGHAWLVFSEGPRAMLKYEGFGGGSVSEGMVVARACCVIGKSAGYPAIVIVAEGTVGGSHYLWLGMLKSLDEDYAPLLLGWPSSRPDVPLFGEEDMNSEPFEVFPVDSLDFLMGSALRGANREIPK